MTFIIHKYSYIYKRLSRLLLPRLLCKTHVLAMCSETVGVDWRGVPINEMYGSQSPWGAPEFPLVSPAFNHAVLFHVPSNGGLVSDRPPKPQIGHDKWDQDHVRLPCSSHSLYPVPDNSGESHLEKRWDLIEKALSKPIQNSQELAEAILSYNTKFRSIWKFRGLHKLFNEYLEEEESQYFFDVTLPEIAKLALALPRLIQSPIPLLKQHKNRSISLSQQQISSLLANAFFCTFPRRNTTKRTSEYAAYPFINFNTHRLYEISNSDSNLEKIKSICHYFRRVCTKVPVGVVTFTRRSVPPRNCPSWGESDRQVATLPVHVDSSGTIEDAQGLIQVDFANKFLGGGVLGYGCVQEEIRFVICPELMVSMLFTEVLRPNEALIIIGCERYSKYTGYGSTYQWAGDYVNTTPYDSSGRRRCVVLAIDAIPFSNKLQEHRREAITRELNKAWVGMSFDTDDQSETLRYPGVATGNWGCGAFGGSPQLKSLLQTMVCAQTRRPMAYYTFGDTELRDHIVNVYNLLARHNVTVGQLYKYLIRYSERIQTNVRLKLYPYLENILKGEDSLSTISTEPTRSPSTYRSSPEVPSEKTTDTEMSEPIIPETVLTIEEDSPDLFSQDEMDISITDKQINETDKQDTATNKETKTSHGPFKPIDTENKIEIKTSRVSLFDTMQKFDENAGTSNPSVTYSLFGNKRHCLKDSNAMDSDEKLDLAAELNHEQKTSHGPFNPTDTETHKIEIKTSRVSLFDTIQKLDENAGTSHSSDTDNASIDSDGKLDPAAELKKKISRKITDYFSKKPI